VREPAYGEHVSLILDKIENDSSRRALWNAICDAIDLVCDHPDSAEVHREAIRLPSGATVWQVPIRCSVEDDDWVLLWYPDGEDAVIAYVGSRMFR
jgi:plasmid stabilization system protein ParE